MLFPAGQATDLEGQMDSFDVDSLERQIFGDAQLIWQDFRVPSDHQSREVSSVAPPDPDRGRQWTPAPAGRAFRNS
jgi:hypothetical protein